MVELELPDLIHKMVACGLKSWDLALKVNSSLPSDAQPVRETNAKSLSPNAIVSFRHKHQWMRLTILWT